MLDLRNRNNWKNQEGFYNIAFITGFIQNLVKTGNALSFCIQQSIKKERYKVIFKKGQQIPSDLQNGYPIKVAARITQDKTLDYPSMVLCPLKTSRPEIAEISATHFNEILHLDLEELNNRNKSLVNVVHVTGYVYAKKVLNEYSMILSLWCGKNALIPVYITGKKAVNTYKSINQFAAIRVNNGKLRFVNALGIVQVVVMTNTLQTPITGNDIPELEPAWLQAAKNKLHN